MKVIDSDGKLLYNHGINDRFFSRGYNGNFALFSINFIKI